jgi:hypothetical protein
LLFWQQTEKEKSHVEEQDGNTARNRFSDVLIGAGMTWQQRLLFVGGIVFGSVVEALPDLVDRLKESLTGRWRLSQVVKRSTAA